MRCSSVRKNVAWVLFSPIREKRIKFIKGRFQFHYNSSRICTCTVNCSVVSIKCCFCKNVGGICDVTILQSAADRQLPFGRPATKVANEIVDHVYEWQWKYVNQSNVSLTLFRCTMNNKTFMAKCFYAVNQLVCQQTFLIIIISSLKVMPDEPSRCSCKY